MEGFRLIDPKAQSRRIADNANRAPSVTELRADAAAMVARLGVYLGTRALDHPVDPQSGCHYCTSGLYEIPPTGCPCSTTWHNGVDVLANRSHLPARPYETRTDPDGSTRRIYYSHCEGKILGVR